MKLHSPAFEKGLRRGVRRAVRAAPALKRDFRAANKFRRHYSAIGFVRLLLSLGLALAAWKAAETTGHPATGLAVMTVWAFVFIFFHVTGLLQRLYASDDLPALNLLPLPAAAVFRWQLQKFLFRSVFLLIDLLAGFGALAAFAGFVPGAWVAVPALALLTWAVVLACAALCAAWRPAFPYPLVNGVVMVVVLALFFLRNSLLPIVLAALDRWAPTLNLVLPTGWPVSLFQCLPPNNRWLYLVLLVPTGAVIWTIRDSLARLQSSYGFKEILRQESPDLVPGEAAELPGAAGTDPDRPLHLGPTDIEQIVESRQFLEAPQWVPGASFERWLWRWFTPREKALAEFVFPNGPAISAPWKKTFRNLGITAVLAAVAGLASPEPKLWVLGGGLFVLSCQVLAQVVVGGRAFGKVQCSGVLIPIYAGFPIGFRELARLLFKCSVAQLPLLMSFTVVAGACTAWLTELPITDGITFGFKIGGLLFATRFIFVTFAFSSGTNDTAAFRLRTVALVVLMIGSGGLFLLLGAGGLFLPSLPLAWGLWALAILDAYGFFRIYGWFYHANRFDLMSVPRR